MRNPDKRPSASDVRKHELIESLPMFGGELFVCACVFDCGRRCLNVGCNRCSLGAAQFGSACATATSRTGRRQVRFTHTVVFALFSPRPLCSAEADELRSDMLRAMLARLDQRPPELTVADSLKQKQQYFLLVFHHLFVQLEFFFEKLDKQRTRQCVTRS